MGVDEKEYDAGVTAKSGVDIEEQRSAAQSSGEDSDRPSEDVQAGVKNIEATTVVWSRTSLIVAYVM